MRNSAILYNNLKYSIHVFYNYVDFHNLARVITRRQLKQHHVIRLLLPITQLT